MHSSTMKQKLMYEIDLLPETKLAEVYDFAHYLRLEVKKQNRENKDLKSEILEIGKYCSSLPVLDNRSPDDILGYDEQGMPK